MLDQATKRDSIAPPHVEAAEQAVIGSAMRGAMDALDALTPGHFFDPAHASLFAACRAIYDKGEAVNPIAVQRIVKDCPHVNGAGGNAYIAHIVSGIVGPQEVAGCAVIVRDAHARRRLLELAAVIQDRASAGGTTDAMEIVQAAEEALYGLAESGAESKGPEAFAAALDEALATIDRIQRSGGKPSGVQTGLIDLDRRVGGFQPGCLYIIAGRPGMGKTDVATNIATNAALAGHQVLYCNMEMGKGEMAHRVIARVAKLPIADQRRAYPPLSREEWAALIDARKDLAALPLHIDETAGLSLSQIRMRARRHKRRHGLDLLVIDYIGLMTPADARANKVHQIEEITKGLKALAKELQVPIIALSQLSRAVETRDDKRPQLSDLRDSGAIEQDADVVMCCYREEYYLQRSEPQQGADESHDKYSDRVSKWMDAMSRAAGIAEIIIAKHRQNQVGAVRLQYTAAVHTLANLHYEGDDRGQD